MFMKPQPLVELILRMAVAGGCGDMDRCRKLISDAALEQRSLVAAVLDAGLVDETKFLKGLGDELGLPWWDEPVTGVPVALRQKLHPRLALRHYLLPVREDDAGFHVLTFDPFDLLASQLLHQSLDAKVVWRMSTRRQIQGALRQGYGVGAETFEDLLENWDSSGGLADMRQETNVVDKEDPDASVLNFVNQLIREALEQKSTDIHFEPVQDDLRVRFRVDGILHSVPVPIQIKLLKDSVISRLKVMAHLDIAERRLPQDGRINLEFEGKPVDVRVVTIPTATGESVSLRLLGQEKFSFPSLGLDAASEKKILELLAMPNGIVLLTGPTGCGKSTTLYTFLSSLNTEQRRIVTIEEPVEHKLPGVMQIAVRPEIELTFANALRTVLRGDPNVIMVGEMRDHETAEIAIRAALTGHLVFSTLHTNDAVGGITRLIDIGVEPFLVGTSVRAFMAQRLVRVLCPKCRIPSMHTGEYLREIGFPAEHARQIFTAKGCEACRNSGYRGRTAIFEICLVSPQMQNLITQKKDANVLRQAALDEGMVALRQAGWNKVIAGITTIEEVVRVTTADVNVLDE